MTFEEKTISSERIYEGTILNLRKDKITAVCGTSYREIIEHKGAVSLAVFTNEKKLVLVKQYRKPLEKVILEVPAGKIDGDEEPLKAAIRELKEETGYTAKNVTYLTEIYPAVGYSQEILYLYLCTDLEPGKTDFDDNEALDILEYDFQEVYKMAKNGEIHDAKTIVTILLAREELQKQGLL